MHLLLILLQIADHDDSYLSCAIEMRPTGAMMGICIHILGIACDQIPGLVLPQETRVLNGRFSMRSWREKINGRALSGP
jgi:hypothetical protein